MILKDRVLIKGDVNVFQFIANLVLGVCAEDMDECEVVRFLYFNSVNLILLGFLLVADNEGVDILRNWQWRRIQPLVLLFNCNLE